MDLSKNHQHTFHSDSYLRVTIARINHLDELGLPLDNTSVLELGSGVGDFTDYFLKKNCTVDSTDGREELVDFIQKRFSSNQNLKAFCLDMENPKLDNKYDVVFCYGLLYHLANPEQAIDFMSSCCKDLLLLETCVTENPSLDLGHISESATDPTQSLYGKGCRPPRQWVFDQLKKRFEYVYVPFTQPNNSQFPTDWKKLDLNSNNRAIFIASRSKIENRLLSESLLEKHSIHEVL